LLFYEKRKYMSKLIILFLAAICVVNSSRAEEIDLFIIAGQSNAQGWQGDATYYPKDPDGIDKMIRFYWQTPRHSSSGGEMDHVESSRRKIQEWSLWS